jgi:hypothetical protein
MPLDCEDTEGRLDLVALENLERNKERVFHHVVVYRAMEHVDASVI